MVKLLMIQPENHEINSYRLRQLNNFSQITMPYLSSYADEKKFTITLIDEYHQKIPYRKSFDLVAMNVNTPNAPHCYEISAKFQNAGAKVVLGGPHATLLPEEAKDHCDFLLIGESEETWPKFLRDFEIGNPKSVYISESPPSLEHLPPPRWDLLSRSRTMKGAVFATRGCPYSCRYCNLKQIYHSCFRMRPLNEVAEEIKAIKSKFFVFWDDNLFADKAYAKALLELIAPLKRKWAAQATLADCEDEDLLSCAKKAGCLYLFAGLESFSKASLIDAGKGVNKVSDYRRVIEAIHKNGIMLQAGIVFGFDSDTPDVFKDALEACESLGIDGATISILTPFPKTPIYEQYKSENRIISNDWSNFNSKTAVAYIPKNMSPEELLEGCKWFRKRFYSLGSFMRRLKVSRTSPFINFAMNLGYRCVFKKVKKKPLLNSNQSRPLLQRRDESARCLILRGFAECRRAFIAGDRPQ
ncbi:MAG: B12-binding domain-containing radical SAM protein [Clostridiales bacterium]|jgi:radical SAM superfamily enzyme YgiQ (UPF0313 family)|nr:B12-binding domain-containing radical SAM protein [Clostridiales bacterium]